MGKRLLILLGVMLMTSGCATMSRDQATVTQLQMRVGELERDLEAKDAKIDELTSEVKDLNYDVKGLKEQSRTTARVSRAVTSGSGSSVKDDGRIIRLPVSAENVQRALKAAGYYSGSIDGKVGSGTKKAIYQFQKDNGLKADGLIGKQTWAELKTYLH